MTNPIPRATAALVLALIASSCAGNTSSDTSDPTPPPSASSTPPGSPQPSPSEPSSAPESGTAINAGPSDFGPMLFDARNQAIYIWESEDSETPECYDDCAEAWPPVLTDGAPTARGEVDASLLGTTKRRDGGTQVTYNGQPLYFYAHEGPGEVKCHNVATHGGLWWVVRPNGKRAP
jgi:predicted lipoprotein with Yx(FWY)xxD motif